MILIKLLRKPWLYLISIIVLVSSIIAQDDDVELRIDFESGSVIANETPKVIKELPDITVPLGTSDTVVADLNEVFSDAESGSALSFGVEVIDPSFLNVKINNSDSAATLKLKPGLRGRTKVIFSASDGSKVAYDTINVIVKKPFNLSGTLNDTIVKSSYSLVAFNKDISHIFPVSTLNEKYRFEVSSSDAALVDVYSNNLSKSITLEIADSSYGKAEVTVSIIDSDGLIVGNTFLVDVRKSYGRKEYKREIVGVNPGFTIYSGIDYSGALFKFWIKDVVGIAGGGYYGWGDESIGFEGQLLIKPPIQFPLHPYIMISGGYHFQELKKTIDYNDFNRDLSLLALRVAGGLDIWMGKAKHHVIGVEVGYSYGEKEYFTPTKTSIGTDDIEKSQSSFKLTPLHLRVSYSIFIKKL